MLFSVTLHYVLAFVNKLCLVGVRVNSFATTNGDFCDKEKLYEKSLKTK